MKSYINMIDVSKKYNNALVLNHVSLDLEQGKIHGFSGQNGSGKTMLFKLISGLIKPTSGEIIVAGKKLGKDLDFPENMGIMIETPGFLSQYSGYKNLEYLAKIRNVISKEDVKSAIQMVGLDADDRKRVGKYSLGMRQRLGIAQAIMENPDLLILDEPMNSLDAEGITLVRSILSKLRETGTTVLLSSHYKDDIDVLCDSVYEVERGVINKIR